MFIAIFHYSDHAKDVGYRCANSVYIFVLNFFKSLNIFFFSVFAFAKFLKEIASLCADHVHAARKNAH